MSRKHGSLAPLEPFAKFSPPLSADQGLLCAKYKHSLVELFAPIKKLSELERVAPPAWEALKGALLSKWENHKNKRLKLPLRFLQIIFEKHKSCHVSEVGECSGVQWSADCLC